MSKTSPESKAKYNAKTLRIAFALNIEQSERLTGLTQREANAIAKKLFLQHIKPSE